MHRENTLDETKDWELGQNDHQISYQSQATMIVHEIVHR